MSKFLEDLLVGVLKRFWAEHEDEILAWVKLWLNTFGAKVEASIEATLEAKTKEMMAAGMVMVGSAVGKTTHDLAKVVTDAIPGDLDDKLVGGFVDQFTEFLNKLGK